MNILSIMLKRGVSATRSAARLTFCRIAMAERALLSAVLYPRKRYLGRGSEIGTDVATQAGWPDCRFPGNGQALAIPIVKRFFIIMEFHKLESEKYFLQDIERRISEAKRQRNDKAFRDFITLLVGLALIPVACVAGENLPAWMAVVGHSIEGLLETFLGNDSPISRALGL